MCGNGKNELFLPCPFPQPSSVLLAMPYSTHYAGRSSSGVAGSAAASTACISFSIGSASVSPAASIGAIQVADTTTSSGPVFSSVTPCVLRPAMRISSTAQRNSVPLCVHKSSASCSRTGKLATTCPLRKEVSILVMPAAPGWLPGMRRRKSAYQTHVR